MATNISNNNVRFISYGKVNKTNCKRTLKSLDKDTFVFSKSASLNSDVPFKSIKTINKKLIIKPCRENIELRPELKSKIKEVRVPSTDKINLNCWFIEPKGNKPTLLFCHGRNTNITKRQDVAEFITKNGYGGLMIEYRGFRNNPGIATEKSLYADAKSGIEFLNKKGIKNSDIIIWGHSLGGGVASEIASKGEFKAVILECTFTHIDDMIKQKIKKPEKLKDNWYNVLTNAFLKVLHPPFMDGISKFNNRRKVKNIQSPLLIVHTQNDPVVPSCMSKSLAKKAPNARLEIIKSNLHTDLNLTGKLMVDFIENL